jgi:hypothetical protein
MRIRRQVSACALQIIAPTRTLQTPRHSHSGQYRLFPAAPNSCLVRRASSSTRALKFPSNCVRRQSHSPRDTLRPCLFTCPLERARRWSRGRRGGGCASGCRRPRRSDQTTPKPGKWPL